MDDSVQPLDSGYGGQIESSAPTKYEIYNNTGILNFCELCCYHRRDGRLCPSGGAPTKNMKYFLPIFPSKIFGFSILFRLVDL